MAKDYNDNQRDLLSLIPKNLRNPMVSSLVNNLFNRFFTSDEAVPMYGYVGRKPASADDKTVKIPQANVERDVNALVPVLSFKHGAETFSFTPEDIIRKAEAIGISEDQSSWLYSQGNNFAPPVDLDKFTNFFNYYWIASALPTKPDLAWNPSLAPEFYTIAKPALDDIEKLNVKTASTANTVLTGSGFYDQTWTITFSGTGGANGSADYFSVQANGAGGLTPDLPNPVPLTSNSQLYQFVTGGKELIRFTIVRDPIFDADGIYVGDESFMAGDSFTITAPFLSSTHSIVFAGSAGVKGKISGVNSLDSYQTVGGVLLQDGDRVLVKDNVASENGIYVVSSGTWVKAADFSTETAGPGARVFVRSGVHANSLFVSQAAGSGFSWILESANTVSNTNDWQESNFWIHRKDLETSGIDSAYAIQATRPIIEYSNDVRLNGFVSANLPSDSGVAYEQNKTEFNQAPLFDLYLYDGTHAGKASSLFFYEQDPTADVDVVLQRRVKKSSNSSADFVFSHGLSDDRGTLFYKNKDGSLHSVWHPGFVSNQVVSQTFEGVGTGTLTVTTSTDPFAAQQIWTLVAIDQYSFSITGSKTKYLPAPLDVVTVGTTYDNGLITVLITAGGTAFSAGDTFKISTGNVETTRYVSRDSTEEIFDFHGGPNADVNGVGAWLVPRMFLNNPTSIQNAELVEGSVYSHFRGILANQIAEENRAFGGSIKLWSEPVNLFASLMMQRSNTPVSIIEFGLKQYQDAIANVIQLFFDSALGYIDDVGVIDTPEKLTAFVNFILDIRAGDYVPKSVFYDTTSPIPGFPPTLPLLGVLPLSTPGVVFDNDLGVQLLRNHDGSMSPLYANDQQFRDKFGIAGNSLPQDMAALLNSVILHIETTLYEGISTQHKTYFSESEVQLALSSFLGQELRAELASWAVQNGYDYTASDYNSADAFTWNYKNSVGFANTGGPVPARWFKALQAHQSTVAGVISTSRPDLEPWKLVGLAADPGAAWDVYRSPLTAADLGAYSISNAKLVIAVDTGTVNTTKSGLPVIDGVGTVSGDRVLLVSETLASNNGIWIVGTGSWTPASDVMTQFTAVNVTAGAKYAGTTWGITSPVIAGARQYVQARKWTNAMWADIAAAKPALKLSVDTVKDVLLPPYVNASKWTSNQALCTTLPPAPDAPYVFGEGSLAETVWLRTPDFRYSLVKALFRKDPLGWIGHMWGFEYLEVDNIHYDSRTVSVPAPSEFLLHGDTIATKSRENPLSLALVTGPIPTAVNVITFTRDAFTSARKQSWTVRANGSLIGYVNEGTLYGTVNAGGYVFFNLKIEDGGIPFGVGDVITVTANGDGSGMSYTFEPATYAKFNGFCQLFTQALRADNIDTSMSFAIKAFREWDVNLGYRAGGLVSTDDLKVISDDVVLSTSSYDLRFKKSPLAKSIWAQALRVTVLELGSHVFSNTGLPIAATNADDWVFRVEGYNSRNVNLDYYALNTAGDFQTFKALSGANTEREWKEFSTVLGTNSTQLPLTIRGLQALCNFVFGYARKLEDDGFIFEDLSSVDAETGRLNGWQLEIEKLIDRVYSGITIGQGHVMNPFTAGITVSQQTGIVSEFFDSVLFDVHAHPGVFDVLGGKIQTSDLTVLRDPQKTRISASVPMFSVHAQITEYEHLFVFNSFASASTNDGLIYDQFSGSRLGTIKFNGRRQGNETMRPEFGGHYLAGGEVRRNIQANADKIQTYYDADHVFEDAQSTKHALALLGFSPKQYMSDLDLSEKSQFNFWRGLVQMKGTNASVDAFLNNNRFKDAKLDEYWAYKVAEYGDSRPKTFPELRLTVDDTIQQFTKLQFDAVTALPGFTQITADDEARWFSIDDLDGETQFAASIVGTAEKTLAVNETWTIDFLPEAVFTSGSGTVQRLNARTFKCTGAGTVKIVGFGPSAPKFNPVKLFNYVDAELVEEIPLWHPAAGMHTPVAASLLNTISNLDPAKYNVSTLVSGNENYDPLRPWGAKELGRIWFDTSNLSYVPYYDAQIFPAVDERLNRWGTLADFSTIDVMEWVESSVPPSEYFAQSAVDAGNADISSANKADGDVHGAKVYSRDRNWSIRPIAWSNASVPIEAAHIGGTIGSRGAFSADFDAGLHIKSSTGEAILDTSTFADLGITVGMHFGEFQDTPAYLRALSENVITSFSKVLWEDTAALGDPYLMLSNDSQRFSSKTGVFASFEAEITLDASTSTAHGELIFSFRTSSTEVLDTNGVGTGIFEVSTFLRARIPNTTFDEEIFVRTDRGTGSAPLYGATFDAQADQVYVLKFSALGLTVRTRVVAGGTFQTDALAGLITQELVNVWMFDAARYTSIVSSEYGYTFLTNDFSDPASHADSSGFGGIGWRAWGTPTQAELDADARFPNSKWYPMVGPARFISPSLEQIQAAVVADSFALNNGIGIQRYLTTWGAWQVVDQVKISFVPITSGDQVITLPAAVGLDRISVYVNGVARLTGTYSVYGAELTVNSVSVGHEIVVIVRAYSPTASELSFDPDVLDDLSVQRQYKIDYQYVSVPIRDESGSITQTKFYFWVKNRSTPVKNKTLSVKAIKQLLTDGPSQYLTFQNLNMPGIDGGELNGTPWYDAVTISGLSYLVTKNDTFKLRFTRNFTLRDEPEGLDLKDTHTEWALIRRGQKTKVPEAIWNKVVNAACGEDAAGNEIPAARRAAYDERNGTRTRFGFGPEQILAPSEMVRGTILSTILNTKLVDEMPSGTLPDYISFLNFDESDQWFITPESTRNILTRIWNEAKVSQINEIFFEVLNDICATNYEMTDLFKTSRLSAYSIKVVNETAALPSYE